MTPKQIFFSTLKDEWSPLLRRLGFKGSGQRFQRELGDIIHTISVQINKYGGSCSVNLGLHLRFLPLPGGQYPMPGGKVRTESCEFQWRLAPTGFTDYWWGYDSGSGSHLPFGLLGEGDSDPLERARHLNKTYVEFGEPRFDRVKTVEQIASLIRVEDIEKGGRVSSYYLFTPARAALTMARIHAHLGNREIAHSFAEAGLSHIGRAGGIRSALEEFLLYQ